ncbi:MAG: epoxide hydrolase family protein [Myxococcota bacterium]
MKPEPFEIAIPQARLDDLRDRVARARLPPDFGNDDWRYGTPAAYLRALRDHWLDAWDWRAHEAAMNAHRHYRVTIDGVPIHFLHEPGSGPDPLPLVLTHGWPWTFWDYAKTIDPLAHPERHGGDPADAFDVIVPSLPGYAFSTPLEKTGVHWGTTAGLWVKLATEVLGHERFAAQGGDWGAIVTGEIGHRFADRLVGLHVTLPGHPVFLRGLSPDDFGPDEAERWERQRARRHTIRSHMAVHGNDPQTLSSALHDSPLGMAAWITERRRAWSDCDGDVERRFSKDDLLTTSALYWLTDSFATSVRFYWENQRMGWKPAHDRTPGIEAPTGVAVLPMDLIQVPRAHAERVTNLVHWSVFPSGGHFAPAEEPERLVEDVRACFRGLR